MSKTFHPVMKISPSQAGSPALQSAHLLARYERHMCEGLELLALKRGYGKMQIRLSVQWERLISAHKKEFECLGNKKSGI